MVAVEAETDGTLIERSCRGRPDAFVEVVRRHEAAVLHASTFAVSALTAAAYLPWLIIGLPVGAWVDRRPARPLMIACDVMSALLYASLPVAAWIRLLSTWQVVAVALLAGTANVVFATAYQVCLPSLVSPAELVAGNARLQGGASVAVIGGRAAAGLAAQALGAATALLFNAACFGVPSLLGRVTASMRFLSYGMIPLGALLAGALGTALGVRDALWIVQVIFAASGLLLLTPRIRAARDLPARPRSRFWLAADQ